MNYLLRAILILSFNFCSHYLQAQYNIIGTVTDESGNKGMEYARVSLLTIADSSAIAGTITDAQGSFSLTAPFGSYMIQISFLGYETFFSEQVLLDAAHPSILLPPFQLKEQATTLDEVEIAAERNLVEVSLDKKIYNVGQDLTNAGATASDILGNIPSITVDSEGNIKLRGSQSVRILVDGRPSGLVAGDGLRQLMGSLIESVEVITNPSARYEAEGNVGIINIVLKKEKKEGFNGSFELILGEPANYGMVANVNYRVKKLNFFLNYGIAYQIQPNIRSLYQEIFQDDPTPLNNDTTFIQSQSGEGRRKGINNNIRGGLDYYINEQNILTASYRFQRTDGKRITDFRYEDFLFTPDNLVLTSLRNQYEEENEPYSEYVLSYKKLFDQEGHELNIDARYLNYWEYSDQTFTELSFLPTETEAEGTTVVQRSINDEFEDQYVIQLDYIQPVGEEGKLEAGFRSSIRDMTNDYIASQQNESGVFETIPEFDNIFVYDEDIYAAYGIWANKHSKISYQIGLRAEVTDVKTTLEETNEVNPRNYSNLFPSAHLSFHLAGNQDIQLSYSRRVRRPVYTELSPFVTLADGRNFFSGNPDLDPEFTHSLEIGHLKYFQKGSLSTSLYYRNSQGTIQRIIRIDDSSADSIGFSTRIPENLNHQHAAGLEMAFGYNLYPWWKLDASANFFRVITDGTNLEETFESDTYTLILRQTSRFTLPNQLSIQFRANYEAPEQTPQGRRKGLYFFDVSIKKTFWKTKGAVTLNALDLFNSRKIRTIIEGETFFSNRMTQFRRRQVNLTLSYRLKE